MKTTKGNFQSNTDESTTLVLRKIPRIHWLVQKQKKGSQQSQTCLSWSIKCRFSATFKRLNLSNTHVRLFVCATRYTMSSLVSPSVRIYTLLVQSNRKNIFMMRALCIPTKSLSCGLFILTVRIWTEMQFRLRSMQYLSSNTRMLCMFSGERIYLSIHAYNYKRTNKQREPITKIHTTVAKLNSILSICVNVNALLLVNFTKPIQFILLLLLSLYIFSSPKHHCVKWLRKTRIHSIQRSR